MSGFLGTSWCQRASHFSRVLLSEFAVSVLGSDQGVCREDGWGVAPQGKGGKTFWAKSENGKHRPYGFVPFSPDNRCTRATNETKRFPGWAHPNLRFDAVAPLWSCCAVSWGTNLDAINYLHSFNPALACLKVGVSGNSWVRKNSECDM